MRICIVYDLVYPHTIGGAERWYHNLAVRLAQEGHEVTYLTMRHWAAPEVPDVPGVEVVAVAPGVPLYVGGRRRILPALVFGVGVLRHLMGRGQHYDVVHTASFPYFSLLAASLVRRRAGYRIFVDWHEVWTRAYWHEYLGALKGEIAWQVQRLCLGLPQRPFCFSRLVERRLRAERVNGEVTLLEGQFQGRAAAEPRPAEPVVVFVGRHIPEKDPVAVVHAVGKARETIPELRGVVYGDGPERAKVLSAIAETGLEGVVESPGFVQGDVIDEALSHALCLVLPSRREGYGLVVLEALSKGTPAIVLRSEDNASTEFIVDGESGFLAANAGEDLAAAIVKVAKAGDRLRASTLEGFRRDAKRRSLTNSLEVLSSLYALQPGL